MKRLLWLTCLCCMGPLAIVGCGDDDSGGKVSEDGGVSNPDLNQINSNIDGINKTVGDLNGNVTDLGTKVTGIDKTVGDLTGQVDDVASRLAKLENPTLPNCSANDPAAACKPDGLNVVSTDITKIVAQLCALEVNCCTKAELALKYGAGIATAADCEMVFFDLLANGFSPNLFNDQYGYVIRNVIDIAQALNSKRIKVAIDTKQVQLCVDSLKKRECPKYEAITVTPPTHCTPMPATSEDDPCDPMLVVNGLQAAGEACDVGNLNVPQCKDKLVCRNNGDTDEGICATPAAAGDGCQNDFECDKDLFCNHATAQCQALGDVGKPCAYIDPTFKIDSSPIDPKQYPQGNATTIDCMPGLTCDPKSKKCVAACSAGAICAAYGTDNGNVSCPAKTVCNVTENPDLYSTWSAGVCRATTALGKPCTNGTECATGNCGINLDNNMVCLDALTANGGACDTGGQADATCKSGFCNRAAKCASTCHGDENGKKVGCPSGYYCAETIGYDDMEVLQYACEPQGASAADCDIQYDDLANDPHTDVSCTSGFCDTSMTPTSFGVGKCGTKAAVDGACTTGRLQQCANTQWCNAAVCAAFIAEGVVCTNQNGSCGEPASYCRNNNGTFSCHVYADQDGACTNDVTDQRCKQGAGLTCDPTDLACRKTGEYPDGAACTSDSQCTNGWCNVGNGYTCEKPVADTKACDSGTHNRCVSGDYCKYPDDDTAGKCVKRLTAGSPCAPRFSGMDCLTNLTVNPYALGTCSLSNDKFLCDRNAVPDGKLFCDGQ